MKVLALASLLCACPALFANEPCNNAAANACCKSRPVENNVVVGAARTAQYVPGLRGKRVALFSNHTGRWATSTPSTLCSAKASMW